MYYCIQMAEHINNNMFKWDDKKVCYNAEFFDSRIGWSSDGEKHLYILWDDFKIGFKKHDIFLILLTTLKKLSFVTV